MRLVAFFLISWLGMGISSAQDAPDRTSMTSREHKVNIKKQAPKQKKIRYIEKNELKNTLYGNACAKQATNRMGFEYVVTPKGRQGDRSNFSRKMSNFGTRTTLTFRNGPFWSLRARNKIKKCRQQSGDYMG